MTQHLTPITRDELKQLKIKEDEQKEIRRQEEINKTLEMVKDIGTAIVGDIYNDIVSKAKSSSLMRYAAVVEEGTYKPGQWYPLAYVRRTLESSKDEDIQNNLKKLAEISSSFPYILMPYHGMCNVETVFEFVYEYLLLLFPDSKVTVFSTYPWIDQIVVDPSQFDKRDLAFIIVDWS